MLLIGLAGFIAARIALGTTDNTNLVPLVLLIGSAVVPVSFVRFCVDEGAFVDMPIQVVGFTFVSGAVMGLLLAAILEPEVVSGTGLGAWFAVGLVEESAKAAAVVWFLRNRSLRTELDGLVLGAAAGMGFAALETAGYGFTQFLKGWIDAGTSAGTLQEFHSGVDAMTNVLIIRMALALFGHGVWTAITGAALWRERGDTIFRVTPGLVLAFALSVTLHSLWDASLTLQTGPALLGIAVVGITGLLLLRFFIQESVQRAALGSIAPPPPPLGRALLDYVAHLFRSRPQQPVAAQPAALSAALSTAAPVVPPPPVAIPRTAPPPAVAPPDARPEPAVRCQRCGTPQPPGTRFCGECGAAIAQPPSRAGIACPACRWVNPPGSVLCAHCGSPLSR
ncbi:MAG: PrsW family intramembrane metalloprotease [Chloroflexi bacterium]|nr:PrsW family intramembrane metalloprotease [Chloroflexota bacterium]